ncbi:MAG: hypothetical protein ACYCXR_10930 [Coriobacteriia bacterium]
MAPYEVMLFLGLVRQAAQRGHLKPRERQKNQRTLALLGMSYQDMIDCIRGLRPEQALSPPWDNRNPGHPKERVCDFGTHIEEHQLYVKIAVVGLEDGAVGAIVSFHLAERPFDYCFEA